MPFPSTFSAFTRVNPSDRLNNPSHSSVHNQVSSALGQVEAVIGTSSSVIGTIIGDLRNASSDGGGHVQTANKGGTGQTSYTKGDLLVATSTSVLSKLAVGTSDGNVLQVDSSVASGIKWAAPSFGTKIANSFQTSVLANITQGSIMSVTVPGSTLGTSGAVRMRVWVNHMEGDSAGSSVFVQARYGSNSLGAATLTPGTVGSVQALFEVVLGAADSTSAQRSFFTFPTVNGSGGASVLTAPAPLLFLQGSSSVNSTANQPLGLYAIFQNAQADNRIDRVGYTVEKIT